MTTKNKHSVVIVAGGMGTRAGGDLPKQFQLLGSKPILMHTIKTFYDFDVNCKIVVVLPEDYVQKWKHLCEEYHFNIAHTICIGGDTRFESVKKGLVHINDDEIVAIHDAARPFVSTELIARSYNEATLMNCGIVPVLHEKNSIRLIEGYGHKVFDRTKIRIVQTPQVFPASLLKNAYLVPFQDIFTDDATVAENDGISITLTPGEEENIKITTPFDFRLAEFILSFRNSE